ncbi:MAG: septum formation initiator family protein [Alphaproteobacteria bacterium]|nr:MAG: septum formation initiator family protein [Alphaproteobacteria bacterium]
MKLFKGIAFVFGVYFLFHLISGQYGLMSWHHLKREIAYNEVRLKKSTEQKNELKHMVTLLEPGNVDGDLLSERARVVLGYAKKDEKVIILR